jgi:hypothetical protein
MTGVSFMMGDGTVVLVMVWGGVELPGRLKLRSPGSRTSTKMIARTPISPMPPNSKANHGDFLVVGWTTGGWIGIFTGSEVGVD